tara:strand:+ start:391 stop:630 length:240 start_codon:yes stop_codon:yes gene_type:complete
MKKNNKTLNHTSNYLSQMIENNFLLRINYLNKKNYSNAFYLKKKYLFIKENLFFLKEFKKNLCLIIDLITFRIVFIKKI